MTPNSPTTLSLEVFDPVLCCATGVCGPEVDPALLRFADDVGWLQAQGVVVRRFNLGQNPMAFVENETVRGELTRVGEAALPLSMAGGRILASGRYPTRDEMAAGCGLAAGAGEGAPGGSGRSAPKGGVS